MTSLENAREFLENVPDGTHIIDLVQYHSVHVLSQVITFLELNEKKQIKSIIEELKSKL